MWNVKSEGTGSRTVWPKDSAKRAPTPPRMPPVAIEQAVAVQGRAIVEGDGEAAVVTALCGGGAAFHAQTCAGASGGGEHGVDDGAGGVGDGEHAAVVLGLEDDAVGGAPIDRVTDVPAAEGAAQFAAAARIAQYEFARVLAGVGDVAAAAARDLDLGQRLGALLEHGDARAGLGGVDGGEDARGAAADDHHLAGGGHVPRLRRVTTGPASRPMT